MWKLSHRCIPNVSWDAWAKGRKVRSLRREGVGVRRVRLWARVHMQRKLRVCPKGDTTSWSSPWDSFKRLKISKARAIWGGLCRTAVSSFHSMSMHRFFMVIQKHVLVQQSPIIAWDLLFQQAIHKEIRKSPLTKDDQVPACYLRKKRARKKWQSRSQGERPYPWRPSSYSSPALHPCRAPSVQGTDYPIPSGWSTQPHPQRSPASETTGSCCPRANSMAQALSEGQGAK